MKGTLMVPARHMNLRLPLIVLGEEHLSLTSSHQQAVCSLA